jgi:hypothetical protein
VSKSEMKKGMIAKLPWVLGAFHVFCMLGVRLAWHHLDAAGTIIERINFSIYWFYEKMLISLGGSTSPRLYSLMDALGIQSIEDYVLWFLWPLLLILGTVQWFLIGLGFAWLAKRVPAGLISNLSKLFDRLPFLQRLLGPRIQPRPFLLIAGVLPFFWFTLTGNSWALCLIITLGFVFQRYCPSLLGWSLLTVIYLLVTSYFMIILTDDLLDLIAGKPTWYFPVTKSFLYFMSGAVFSVAIAAGLFLSKPYRLIIRPGGLHK